jgi:hypothetical protein
MTLLGAIILVLDVYAIASVLLGSSSVERKLLWTLVILLLPVLGMVLYFLIGRTSADVRLEQMDRFGPRR